VNADRWLRLYPAAWRERYGAELADLLADCSAAGRLRRRDRFDLVLAAARERWRAVRAAGAGAEEPARAGVLRVLACWAMFVVAGGAVAKFSEHWQDRPTYPAPPRIAAVAFDVLRGSAVAGGVAVLLGAGVALPALRAFLRSGGWAGVRRAARPAAVLTAVTLAATGGLVAWANDGLSEAARNGGDPGYGAAFLCWAGLLVVCLAASTVAGVRIVRLLTFSGRTLRLLAGCSVVVAAAIVAATAATLVWWVALARSVPWVLDGSRVGSTGSTAPLVLCGSAGLMLLSGLGALAGARRAWRATAHQPLVNVTV
jgi:hypothetical protein